MTAAQMLAVYAIAHARNPQHPLVAQFLAWIRATYPEAGEAT